MKLKMAIFTINSEKSTNLILEKFRLKQFFDATVPREAVSKVKPDPAHLDAALRALNVTAEEAVVVGDSAVDVKSAMALKTTPIGIAYGDVLVRELSQAGAVHVARSIAELPALIAKLNRP
jgi:phosphoglycolate phosphatase-like HAD superfamily hydrolase